jgi:hypothetical protein
LKSGFLAPLHSMILGNDFVWSFFYPWSVTHPWLCLRGYMCLLLLPTFTLMAEYFICIPFLYVGKSHTFLFFIALSTMKKAMNFLFRRDLRSIPSAKKCQLSWDMSNSMMTRKATCNIILVFEKVLLLHLLHFWAVWCNLWKSIWHGLTWGVGSYHAFCTISLKPGRQIKKVSNLKVLDLLGPLSSARRGQWFESD